MKKLSKTAKILGILMIVLIMGTVFVSISYSSKGSELLMIEREIAQVERENRDIKTKVIKETSLTKLTEAVDELELIKPEETAVVYLSFEQFDLSYAKSN